ncbi:hypothetical protein RvY_05449-4 [Ramazzottius varieornatus]|uniref:Uncharacterized protein n=1 Tax=Ramazzottius varieornatus TaxID=947166 RepID=A0A1D1V429_RAMVA|nr:hypothetical protein RvY_05449-4 [Ramazzottius varieornatus]
MHSRPKSIAVKCGTKSIRQTAVLLIYAISFPILDWFASRGLNLTLCFLVAIIHMLKFLTPPENALPVTDQILSIWRFFDPELSTREQCTKEQLSFLETFEARETIRTLTKNNRVLETKVDSRQKYKSGSNGL